MTEERQVASYSSSGSRSTSSSSTPISPISPIFPTSSKIPRRQRLPSGSSTAGPSLRTSKPTRIESESPRHSEFSDPSLSPTGARENVSGYPSSPPSSTSAAGLKTHAGRIWTGSERSLASQSFETTERSSLLQNQASLPANSNYTVGGAYRPHPIRFPAAHAQTSTIRSVKGRENNATNFVPLSPRTVGGAAGNVVAGEGGTGSGGGGKHRSHSRSSSTSSFFSSSAGATLCNSSIGAGLGQSPESKSPQQQPHYKGQGRRQPSMTSPSTSGGTLAGGGSNNSCNSMRHCSLPHQYHLVPPPNSDTYTSFDLRPPSTPGEQYPGHVSLANDKSGVHGKGKANGHGAAGEEVSVLLTWVPSWLPFIHSSDAEEVADVTKDLESGTVSRHEHHDSTSRLDVEERSKDRERQRVMSGDGNIKGEGLPKLSRACLVAEVKCYGKYMLPPIVVFVGLGVGIALWVYGLNMKSRHG